MELLTNAVRESNSVPRRKGGEDEPHEDHR
jgi:hypothetical protein